MDTFTLATLSENILAALKMAHGLSANITATARGYHESTEYAVFTENGCAYFYLIPNSVMIGGWKTADILRNLDTFRMAPPEAIE